MKVWNFEGARRKENCEGKGNSELFFLGRKATKILLSKEKKQEEYLRYSYYSLNGKQYFSHKKWRFLSRRKKVCKWDKNYASCLYLQRYFKLNYNFFMFVYICVCGGGNWIKDFWAYLEVFIFPINYSFPLFFPYYEKLIL